jgi:hypothetical protein
MSSPSVAEVAFNADTPYGLYGTVQNAIAGEVYVLPDGLPAAEGVGYVTLREEEFRLADTVPLPGLRVKYKKDRTGMYPFALVGVQCMCWKEVGS